MNGEIIISDEYMGYTYFFDASMTSFSLDIYVSKDKNLESVLKDKEEFIKAVNSKLYEEKLLGFLDKQEMKVIEELRDNFDDLLDYVEYIKIYNVNTSFRELIDQNPIILTKKIVLLENYSICDYDKIKEIADNNKDIIDRLFICLDGNNKYVSLPEALKTIEEIHHQIGFVKQMNLSEMETIMFLYDYVRNRVYKFEDENEDYTASRDLCNVLFGDKIVCVGYTNLFNSMLNYLGIEAEPIYYEGLDENNNSSGHVRTMIKVNDPKYNISGLYLFDPTWDSKREEDSVEYLSSYRFFAKNVAFMEPYDRCVKLEQNKYLKYYKTKYYLPLKTALKNNDKESIALFVETLNHFARRIIGSNLISPVYAFNGNIDNKTQENILEKFMIICSYFKKNISAEKMILLASNVRKVEYYVNHNYYPYSIEDLYEIARKSKWNFKTEHLSPNEKLIRCIFGEDFLEKRNFMHDFIGYTIATNIERDIECTRLCKVLRLTLDKKKRDE